MATRSTIAIEHADGSIDKVYCHWDGYLSNNGKILLEHYSDPTKLMHLLAEGDLSSLGTEIGEKHEFDNPHKFGTEEYKAHRAKYEHMCLFYGRDRGETEVGAKHYKNFSEYLASQSEEYNYILKSVGNSYIWFVEYSETEGKFMQLSKALHQEAIANSAVE